jgi:hypothetical protein
MENNLVSINDDVPPPLEKIPFYNINNNNDLPPPLEKIPLNVEEKSLDNPTEKVKLEPEKFIDMCLEGQDLSHDDFVKKYAQVYEMTEDSANAVIWAGSFYKKYSDKLREKNNSDACEDCGLSRPLSKYYCGEFNCGKGYWCRKYEYYLCGDCAYKRY